jgi:HD-GYP domain-containing protein (c-di-GMP phosphodiesterase class II)
VSALGAVLLGWFALGAGSWVGLAVALGQLALILGLAARLRKARGTLEGVAGRIRDEPTLLTGWSDQGAFRCLGGVGRALATVVSRAWEVKRHRSAAEILPLKTMAIAMEHRDPYTQGHCFRVRTLTRRILDRIDASPELRELTETAALLHDIGKMGIPDEVLLKKGPLTPQEFDHIKLHSTIGEEIILTQPSLRELARVVRHHHERCDGSGYPDGLQGEEIPLPSRIIGVADSVDAMRSTRPYRAALSVGRVIAELRAVRGTKLDADLVDIAIDILKVSLLQKGGGSFRLPSKRAPGPAGVSTRRESAAVY